MTYTKDGDMTDPQTADIHPRDRELDTAGRELIDFLKPWQERHHLTGHEYCLLLMRFAEFTVSRLCLADRLATPMPEMSNG